MALEGADVEALRNVGQSMTSKADEIKQTLQNLDGQLKAVQWLGPDADKFRGDWQSNVMSRLMAVADALGEAGRNAVTQAQQQSDTSAR